MSIRSLAAVLVLALGCAGSRGDAALPEEPRQVDPSITEELRADAARTLEDCDEKIEVLLLEGDAHEATYLTRACGHVYSYRVHCRHDQDHPFDTCDIASSEEVDDEEAPDLLEEARRREAGEDDGAD